MPVSTTLTPGEIALFDQRGYHIHNQVFSDAEIAAINAATDRVMAGQYDKGTPPDGITPRKEPVDVFTVDNTWKADTTLARAVLSPRIGHIAAQLISAPTIRMWHDRLLEKPPHGGRAIAFHQDWAYWQMIAECQTVTCWIALDDVLPDSGPMVFLEGSHKLGIWKLHKGIKGDDAQKPNLPAGFKTREVPVIIPKGTVSFHHGLLFHGSDRNFSPSRRRAIVSFVISGECTYRPGQDRLYDWTIKRYPEHPQPGGKFRGSQFPQMWPATVAT